MSGDAPGEQPLRSLSRRIFLASGLILGGIALAAALGAADVSMLPGAACGAAIACGNFFLIRRILEKAFSGGGAVNKAFVVQYTLKFLGLIAVIFLVVRYGGFDVLGFLLGLSSLFLGVLFEALARSFDTKA
ncbi:MAG: ATP synthase subunit I [Deltaproteobacteria bacterium]|nr:ATP synthase subunit I [Deltaproteobacteria bacterium]